jgi:hypothetical protein
MRRSDQPAIVPSAAVNCRRARLRRPFDGGTLRTALNRLYDHRLLLGTPRMIVS